MARQQTRRQFAALRPVPFVGIPLSASRCHVVPVGRFFQKQGHAFSMTARGKRTLFQFPLERGPAWKTMFERERMLDDAQCRCSVARMNLSQPLVFLWIA